MYLYSIPHLLWVIGIFLFLIFIILGKILEHTKNIADYISELERDKMERNGDI